MVDSQDLKQYPGLRAEVGAAAIDSLEKMRDESKKATLQLVDMEYGYLTVDFFRKLPQDVDKGGNPTHSIFDRYNDSYLRRIGKSSKTVSLCLRLILQLCSNSLACPSSSKYIVLMTASFSFCINRNHSFVLCQYGLCYSAAYNSKVNRLLSSAGGKTNST